MQSECLMDGVEKNKKQGWQYNVKNMYYTKLDVIMLKIVQN